MSEMKHDETNPPHVPVHGPAHGVAGEHTGTTFEGTDASVGMVVGSLGVIALTLVITAIITFPIQNLLKTANPIGNLPSPLSPERVIPPAPRIEVHPWEVLPELRKHEQAVLTSSGNNTLGQTHIPISEALEQVASKLPTRPDAAPGLTVPGGQGRDFAGSLSGMPAPYQAIEQQAAAQQAGAAAQAAGKKTGPTIQGEIRKNAKQQ